MKKFFTLMALVAISFSSMAQWLPQASGFTAVSRGIQFMSAVSDQVVWATAYDGSGGAVTINEFTRTINGGDLWTPGQVLGGTVYGLGNICALSGQIAYVSLYKGAGAQDNTCGVYKTSNGGVTWTQLPGALQGAASFANNVYFWNEQEGMCHGDVKDGYFEIYTTINGGTSWQRVPQTNITGGPPASGEGGWTSVIDAIGENTIMFGTNKSKVYISDDRGLTWRVSSTGITPATNGGINEIAFTDPDNGIVTQTVAPVAYRRTSDGGATWESFTPTGPFLANDLAAIPGSSGTYISTGAATGATGVAYSYDKGNTWAYFPDTEAIQFLATDWIDSSTGWCGAFNESNTVGGMYKFTGSLEEPLPPTNFQGTVTGGNDVNLTWDAPLGSRALLGYNVWRNGAKIANQITDIFYNDLNLANGGYSYLVTAVYDNGESVPAGPVEIEITGGGTLTSIILDFEAQEDFAMTFEPWEAVDLDGSDTYTITDVTFPNQGLPMAFIAFNPLTTTPPVTGMTTHGGDRLGACFASVTPPNNDWLISPQVTLGENPMLSMWVKSYTDAYGLEKYNVLVSTTDNNPSSFTQIAGPIDAPVAAWTYVEYDLGAYQGQAVYVAIQCVSNDAFIFLVDDISISFFISTNDKPLAESLKVYPNPVDDVLNIQSGVEITNARLFNISGQLIFESNGNSNEMRIRTSEMPSGLYLLNITTKQGVITRKVSIR